MATRRVRVPSRYTKSLARALFPEFQNLHRSRLQKIHPARVLNLREKAKKVERWERMRKIARGAFDRIERGLAIHHKVREDVPVIISGAHTVSELKAALYAEAHLRLQPGDTMTMEPYAPLCALRVTVVRSTFALLPAPPVWVGTRDADGFPQEWRI